MSNPKPFDPIRGSKEQLPDIDPDSRAVGKRIRELRKVYRVTLGQLSERTGLSIGHLSQVERGISSPTLNVLFRISRAFELNITYFLDAAETNDTPAEAFVSRAARRRELYFGDGISDMPVNTAAISKLQVLISTFKPGASVAESYSHEGEECGLVLSGSLELWIGEEMSLLMQNDAFSFPSSIPHRYRNPGITQTVVVWAMTPPTY